MNDTTETPKVLGPKYAALCDRVERLDPEAAKYMRSEALSLTRFDQCGRKDPENIDYAFVWDETPQGHEFWDDLNEREMALHDKKKATK